MRTSLSFLLVGVLYVLARTGIEASAQDVRNPEADVHRQGVAVSAATANAGDDPVARIMAKARSEGLPTPRLIELWELWSGVRTNGGWSQYVQTYSVQIQDPDARLVYDLRDPVTKDWSTLTNAVRCFEHALLNHDTPTLFAMADTTGAAGLEDWGMSRTNPSAGQKMWYTNATRETWLFVSRMTFDKTEYSVVFLRRQHPTRPTDNPVAFPFVPLKRVESGWLLTGDLSGSGIGAAWTAAGAQWPHGPYTNAYELHIPFSLVAFWRD